MAGFTMSVLSTQYVIVPVRAWNAGQPFNPASPALPVQMAFVNGWTGPVSWNTAAWSSASTINGYYQAQCLVGPDNGGVVLAVGTYEVWVQVTGSPEVPIAACGTLTLT